MYPCLPTKCGLVFCPHLRYLTISSFSRREALTCANQPFCSLGRVWSLITPDCSRSHGYLKSPASLFLREPHGMFLASIDLYHCSLSLLGLCGSVVPYSGFWDFLPSRVSGFLPLRWMLYSETVYCLL